MRKFEEEDKANELNNIVNAIMNGVDRFGDKDRALMESLLKQEKKCPGKIADRLVEFFVRKNAYLHQRNKKERLIGLIPKATVLRKFKSHELTKENGPRF